MRRKGVKELALKLSEGLAASVVDLVLYFTFFHLYSMADGLRGNKAVGRTDKAFAEINYKTIKGENGIGLKEIGLGVNTMTVFRCLN